MSKGKKVAVGMSGGVDSSVAAYLLKKQGYNVTGVTMAIWDGSLDIPGNGKDACYSANEAEDIEAVENICKDLDIPFYVVDLKQEYSEYILDYFKSEYLAGRTPNPCVRCNHKMKFGFLLEKLRQQGVYFDYFATGHYARVVQDESGRYVLKKALNIAKDQTYFIHALDKELLPNLLFPLGELTKEEVRSIAREIGLDVADKTESQDFISGDYSVLFKDEDIKPGDIVDEDGTVMGTHSGIINYTIGQRRGLGISYSEPLYVTRIDKNKNQVVVGTNDKLFSAGLIASQVTLSAVDSIDGEMHIKAKIRQQHKEADAVLSSVQDGRVKLMFEEMQLSVTPGQAVVFYKDDIVLGGGIIDEAVK